MFLQKGKNTVQSNFKSQTDLDQYSAPQLPQILGTLFNLSELHFPLVQKHLPPGVKACKAFSISVPGTK